MSLKKLQFTPGVNKEGTRYAAEGLWYDSDKVRFRQGYPEKIGGWQRISDFTFLGVCRSLWAWSSLAGLVHRGVGTNLKFYVERGGEYYDITPIRETTSAGDSTFTSTIGSSTITVSDTSHGATEGDFVTFSAAATLGTSTITAGVLNQEYQIASVIDVDTYTIIAKDVSGNPVVSDEAVAGGGGAATIAEYQIRTGDAVPSPGFGWGAGAWSLGSWGITSSLSSVRLWSQASFGEDLVFGPRDGAMYYWDLSAGVGARAVELSTLPGASAVPLIQKFIFISDTSRFVFAFGCNPFGSTTQDPMLIRWSDQENAVDWTPSPLNQSGEIRLSSGTQIVTARQSRQEILVWTNSSLYSLQYVGPPIVWGSQLVGNNITIASQNATAYANGVTYWMGRGRFYMYDGRTQPLNCDLLRYIFNGINDEQYEQVFAGTNEEFHEIWWFYCSVDSTQVDRYVIFNYQEQIWYHGNLSRSAWLDSCVCGVPFGATYEGNIVQHETGVDDLTLPTPAPIPAHITSAETALEDGERFSFIWRVLPDVTFEGSTTTDPTVNLTLLPLKNSGSGYNNPLSEGGVSSKEVVQTASVPVERFTEQVNIRVRGRQLVFKISSEDEGVTWQLGVPRIDIRPDGRR